MPGVYSRVAKITNAAGRSGYLGDEKRQEEIVLQKSEMRYSWQQHADFERTHQKTDVANHEALYSAKRKELDLNYRNQENALRGQIKALEERIETQREESGKLDKEIDRKKEDIQLIEEHLKDRKFWDGMKKTWLDHWLPMLTAGFLAVFLGGFFGWGTYGIANEIFKGLVNLIKG